MPRPIFSPPARIELLQIWSFVAGKDFATADRVLLAIREKCQMLADHPGFGQLHPEHGLGIRSFTVGNYVVYFRSVKKTVRILRVVHGSRDASAFDWDEQ